MKAKQELDFIMQVCNDYLQTLATAARAATTGAVQQNIQAIAKELGFVEEQPTPPSQGGDDSPTDLAAVRRAKHK